MNKLAAIEYLKEKEQEGYVTHSMILDIYRDDEEVPEYVLALIVHDPLPPRVTNILTGLKGSEALEEALEDEYKITLFSSAN